MFCGIGRLGLYFEPMGLAEARILVRALRVVMMPAFAMETVCCSMTSWRTERVESDILSNSSMQQIPPSDKTRAPLLHLTFLFLAGWVREPFKDKLLCVDVAGDVCCKTYSTATLPTGIHSARRNLVHILSHEIEVMDRKANSP